MIMSEERDPKEVKKITYWRACLLSGKQTKSLRRDPRTYASTRGEITTDVFGTLYKKYNETSEEAI